VYLVCRIYKRNGRYAIGSLSTSTGNLADALTRASRMAQSARWRRLIPIGEIDAANTRVLRAWETRDGGGIAVITDTTDRVPIAPPVSPSLA
jgi:hypothetical protein